MSPLRALVAALALPTLVWAFGQLLMAMVARTPPAPGSQRLYLAGRVDRLHLAAVVAYDDELLVSLASERPTELTARAWRVVADPSARTRLDRWLVEATGLRAYRGADGAIMLTDPTWGGNVACEPAVTVG